jgi:hypothetical protein
MLGCDAPRSWAEPRVSTTLHVSGIVFHTQQAVLRSMVGDQKLEAAIEALEPADRKRVRGALALEWIPLSLVEALVTRVAALRNASVESTHRELVHETARRTLRGLWKLLARFASTDMLVSRIPTLWRRTYDRGEPSYERIEAGRQGRVTIRGIETASDYALRGVAFSIEAMIEHANGKPVRVRWHREPEAVVYDVEMRLESIRPPSA